jgi:hypothetical protein
VNRGNRAGVWYSINVEGIRFIEIITLKKKPDNVFTSFDPLNELPKVLTPGADYPIRLELETDKERIENSDENPRVLVRYKVTTSLGFKREKRKEFELLSN